jgi:uncharacterized membrane protein YkvA (DUF1232 family)
MNPILLFFRTLFDRRTPLTAKLIIVGAALYGISPIDLIPDFIPVIGELDDITVIIIAIILFMRMTKSVRGKRDDVIDGKIVE